MILDAWGWCTGTTQRDGMGREDGGVFRHEIKLKFNTMLIEIWNTYSEGPEKEETILPSW